MRAFIILNLCILAILLSFQSSRAELDWDFYYYTAGQTPVCIKIRDVNGDRNLDLLAANWDSNNASVLLGNGDGTFQTAVHYAAGNFPSDMAIGDLDKDGNFDMAVSNKYGGDDDVSVLMGNGDGTFKTAVNYTAGDGPNRLAIGDLNNDDYFDLAVANNYSDDISVLIGDGDGTFQAPMNYPTGDGAGHIEICDLNNDNKLDLVVANTNSNNVSVLVGNGNGTFQTAVNYPTGDAPIFIKIGNLNSDCNLDMAVVNALSGNVSVFLGNGDGTFQTAVAYPAGESSNGLAIGDLNNDGMIDLAVTNKYSDEDLSVLLGNGDGTFQAAIMYYASGIFSGGIAAGDLNSDGWLDLAIANVGSSDISVFINISDEFEDFIYEDDVFYGTNQPAYANGDYTGNFGYCGSAGLHVCVGNVDGKDIINGMSGGWSKDFYLAEESDARISLKYRLMTSKYDADECGQALVGVDGDIVMELATLCGRALDTGWQMETFNQVLTEGNHTLTVGAYNNKKTGKLEKTDAYFDDILLTFNYGCNPEAVCNDELDDDGDGLIDCGDSDCRDSSYCTGAPVLFFYFNTSDQGFVYGDDTFYNTNHPQYASGDYALTGGYSGSGGLHLKLGNVDRVHILDGMSGGWSVNFSVGTAGDYDVTLKYRLIMNQYDADECARVLAKIDDGSVEVLEEECGRGIDTGWITKTFTRTLLPGDHTLTIGGYNNKKTGQLESADIYFDDVEIRIPHAPVPDYEVIDTFFAGDVTQGVDVNPLTNRIYVAALGDNAVYVIDGGTNTVITTIPVGVWPRSVAVDVDSYRIYVGNSESSSVSVIDGFTNTVIDTIPVGSGPSVNLNPNTDRLYVPNYNDDTVSVIDTTTNTVIDTIPVGDFPAGVAINLNANIIYVSNRFEDTVSVIDGSTNTAVNTIPVGFYPGNPDYNQITDRMYLPIRFDGVWIFDGADNSLITKIATGDEPSAAAVDITRNHIYVTNSADATVSIINGASNVVADTVPIGPQPSGGIAVNQLTDRIYVTHQGEDTLSVIAPAY